MISNKKIIPPLDDTVSKSYGLFEWQSFFSNVFYPNNQRIKQTGYQNNQVAFLRGYVVSHISQDLGDFAEALRESDNEKLRRKTGSMFAWIFALANELQESLEVIIYDKYPGFCPYCGHKYHCQCAWWLPSQTKKGKDRIHTEPIESGEGPHTKPNQLSGWITTWELIYGKKYKIAMTVADIMYKLLEEEAEILEELDKAKGGQLNKSEEYYKKLTREVADFVSWYFALLYKLQQDLPPDQLSKILYEKFKEGCPWCEKQICECYPEWLEKS